MTCCNTTRTKSHTETGPAHLLSSSSSSSHHQSVRIHNDEHFIDMNNSPAWSQRPGVLLPVGPPQGLHVYVVLSPFKASAVCAFESFDIPHPLTLLETLRMGLSPDIQEAITETGTDCTVDYVPSANYQFYAIHLCVYSVFCVYVVFVTGWVKRMKPDKHSSGFWKWIHLDLINKTVLKIEFQLGMSFDFGTSCDLDVFWFRVFTRNRDFNPKKKIVVYWCIR